MLLACGRGPAEDFTRVEPDPEPLLAGLASYATPEVVAQSLGVEWTVTEKSSLAEDDPRPRYDILATTLPSFVDRGHPGELRLLFFNGRLVSTTFYPRDPGAYRAAVGEFAERAGHLRSQWAVDHQGREYFVRSDDRLLEQQHRWLERFS